MNNKTQLFLAVILLIGVITGVQVWSHYHVPGEVDYFGEAVADSRSYKAMIRKMTEISPTVKEDKIILPFSKVDRHDIVYFEVEKNDRSAVPVMAYITPSGRLFVGISYCEGCGGKSFSLAGDTLLSENCRTIFNIEDHSFIRGSSRCGEYPPQPLDYTLDEDTLIILLEEILGWQPRYQQQGKSTGGEK